MKRQRQIERMYEDLMAAVRVEAPVPCETYPDAFFPEDMGKAENQARELARSLCQTCPLRLQCLEYALAANEPFGIWGGFTFRERQEMKRERRNF